MQRKIGTCLIFLVTACCISADFKGQLPAVSITAKSQSNIHPPAPVAAPNTLINVLELRNYLVRPGQRERFINYFEENFIAAQNNLGARILGQYLIKAAPDNFCWLRGFAGMEERKNFLTEFYRGAFWKAHRALPNSLLLNNDNVYLLQPLNVADTGRHKAFNSDWFGMKKGIAVVDFYTSNTKRGELIGFIDREYASLLKKAGIRNTSFWVSETKENDFPALPVFRDQNLLVQVSFYKDEREYRFKMKALQHLLTGKQQDVLFDLVTVKHSVLLYPTVKSFSVQP